MKADIQCLAAAQKLLERFIMPVIGMDSRFVRVEEDLGQNQKLWRSLSNFSILALSCFTSYNYQTVLVRVARSRANGSINQYL